MNDPAYDDEVPIENEADYQRALDGHAHIPESYAPRSKDGEVIPGRWYRCVKCLEPLYAVPRGVGEFVDG